MGKVVSIQDPELIALIAQSEHDRIGKAMEEARRTRAVDSLRQAAQRSVDWMMQYDGRCMECSRVRGKHIPGCWVGAVESALATFGDVTE